MVLVHIEISCEELHQTMKTYQYTKLVAALAAVGLVGVAGAQVQSTAIAANPDGLGEALIYPFYSVQNGNATLLSVVNTTDQGKVVKIRFREYANSEDVRDFNIYLSAKDVWTAAVLPVGSSGMTGSGGFTGAAAGGAMVVTQDTTCTAPNKTSWQDVTADFGGVASYAVPFSKADYENHDNSTRGSAATQTLERTTRGYFEVIEQATVPTSTTMYTRIDHRVAGQGGKPNCAGLHALSPSVNTSYQYSSFGLTAPSGGLFGSVAWLSLGNGASTAISATAMNGFSRAPTVYFAGDEKPNFTDHLSTRTVVTTTERVVIADFAGSPTATGLNPSVPNAWAASAPLFATNIYGEYFYSSDLAGSTDWVITMPGKRHFVTFAGSGSFPATDAYAPTSTTTVPPFANSSYWRTASGTGQYTSPVALGGVSYDREEATFTQPGCLFSPCDRTVAETNALPHESNVVAFGASGQATTAASGALNANNSLWLLGQLQTPTVGGGWFDLSFTGTRPVVGSVVGGVLLGTGASLTAGASTTFNGLPVIGFQVTSAKSVQAGGLRDNYRHSSNLAIKKSVN